MRTTSTCAGCSDLSSSSESLCTVCRTVILLGREAISDNSFNPKSHLAESYNLIMSNINGGME